MSAIHAVTKQLSACQAAKRLAELTLLLTISDQAAVHKMIKGGADL